MSDDHLDYIGKMHFVLKNDVIDEEMYITHYHNAYEFLLLFNAENELLVRDTTYLMQPRQIIYIPPYTMHSLSFKQGTLYVRYLLNFERDYLLPVFEAVGGGGIVDMFDNMKPSVIELEPQVFARISTRFKKIDNLLSEAINMDAAYAEMKLRLDLASLLIDLAEIYQTMAAKEKPILPNHVVNDVIAYLNEHYSESIALEDLERRFFISKYYLCHAFKKTTGLSVIQYLNHIRIAEAQKLIIENKQSIREIGAQCGFNNIQHFYRVFKRVTLTTPGVAKSAG